MSNKGISPLIATILLIAFVIAVGGILSGWMISFTKERTEEARTKGETDIKCSYSSLYISDANWNSSQTKLSLTAENTGSEDLTDFRMIVVYNNNSAFTLLATPASTALNPGDVEVFYNDTVSDCDDISEVILKSNTCPNDARDSILQTDISDCP